MINKGINLARIDAGLEDLFDWFTALPKAEAAQLRDEILPTMLIRPMALLLSGTAILLMSATTMVVVQKFWAVAWFVLDLVLLATRFWLSVRYERHGGVLKGPVGRAVVCCAFCMFSLFSFGCAAALLTGDKLLTIMATVSTMAVISGLSTRWATLPRLALGMILILAGPFCTAMAMMNGLLIGAIHMATVSGITAMLTLQNRANLLGMIRAERHNRMLAATDYLTGLPNRAGLMTELDRLKQRARHGPASQIGLLFIDLDHFKIVNDRYGHSAGDRALIAVGQRLRKIAGQHFACRLGGDEFVMLIEDGDRGAACTLAEQASAELALPIHECTTVPVTVGGSIGLSFSALAEAEVEQLLADADLALYRAKADGRGGLAIHEAWQPATT